jgi:hypothetical protein
VIASQTAIGIATANSIATVFGFWPRPRYRAGVLVVASCVALSGLTMRMPMPATATSTAPADPTEQDPLGRRAPPAQPRKQRAGCDEDRRERDQPLHRHSRLDRPECRYEGDSQ